MKLTKPQIMAIVTPIITLAAGYFGYQPIQELKSVPQDVTVDVHIPEQKDSHTHPTHSHKDWTPIIDAKVKKAIDGHNEAYH